VAPILVKREDLSSSRFGGNKVRKLELLLAGSRRPVLTFGPRGSHHALATAVHAADLGRECVAVLVPQEMSPHHEAVHRLIRARCTSTLIVDDLARLPGELAALAARIASRGADGLPDVIAPGGSSPRGTLGYVACGLELAGQIDSGKLPFPDRVYTALGSGGTAAGLALGLALGGVDAEVVAVRVASRATGNRAYLRALALAALGFLRRRGVRVEVPDLRLAVDHRFIGPGYAHQTEPAARAVEVGGELGLTLETTYTGKAFAALLDDLDRGRAGKTPLFVHTAGAIEPLLGEGTAPKE
jgi:1-aminocyclopropane-1-carboxylate deaminase/D-cysteine desulfhydrase-like pyridoxal-dependent ACC family enzyme